MLTAPQVVLTCMVPEMRDQLDQAVRQWRAFSEQSTQMGIVTSESDQRAVYRAFYWLFRHSGLMKGHEHA